jgi:hypothetical protein
MMAGGRENKKKGFQARASSRIVVNKPAHDPIIKESSDVEPAMPMGTENKKGLRIKGIALKVDTKLAQEVYNGDSAGGAAKPLRKATNAETSKISEAMMNKNWRNPRQRFEYDITVSDPDDIWSAPPDKPNFSGETRVKPQRNDENEVIDYERGLKRVAYRCRKPEDVRPELIPFTSTEDVDPSLCLSAPATKLEFLDAEIGGKERSEKYNPSVFQPAVKAVVRLDQMAPIKRAGYEKIIGWDENADPNNQLQESSSITAVSKAGPDDFDWEKIEFPFAEIRPVKGEHRFPTELNGVEKTLRKQLSELVVPQSAGLPPEYLRKEYQVLREERQKAINRLKSRINDGPALKEVPENLDQEEVANEGNKDNRLNALLGKLNRLCAPRLRACTFDNPDNAQNAENKDKKNSPSGDSGVSGLSPKARKRSSSLNPAAVEFRCTTQQHAGTAGCSPASIPGLSGPATSVVAPAEYYASKDPIKLLETRVAELEAQIARQQSKKTQYGRQKWAGANSMPYVPGQNNQTVARGASCHGMNGALHGLTGYAAPQNFPLHQTQPGRVFGPGMQAGPIVTANHYGFAQAQNGMAPNIAVPTIAQEVIPCRDNGLAGQPNTLQQPVACRENSFTSQPNMPQASAPYHVCGPSPAGAAGGTGAAVGTGGTTGWVKSMFGPKPVAKPKGPFRPGDMTQAMRQQQYEEYLEHLRATDPSYAMKCRQRQARRADRRRLGTQSEGISMGAN